MAGTSAARAMPVAATSERQGSGLPIVVLHRDLGVGAHQRLVTNLAQQYEVHTLSLPGFGSSPLPGWVRSVAHVAAVVGLSMDEQFDGDPVPVVGLGFGGWVAAELLAYSPARVARLALVSPMGLKPAAGEIADQFLFAARSYAALSLGGPERLDEACVGLTPEAVDELLDAARETMTRVAWKPIGHDPALPGLLAATHRVPVSVVWGGADAVVPASTARQWADLLHAETATVIPGGAHHVEHAHADVVAASIAQLLAEPTLEANE